MSTPPRIWTTEDAQQLNELREAAGLDIAILAKRHSLSVHQVRQLEEGGDDRFYSQAIKLQVGRKLLRSLGGDLVELPQPDGVTDPSAELQPAPVLELQRSTVGNGEMPQSKDFQKSGARWWVPLAGVTLVALAWLGWQQSVSDAGHQKKNTKPIATAPAAQAADTSVAALDPSSGVSAAPEEAPPSPAETQAETQAETVSAAATDCLFGSEPKRVSVFEPRRPGNYVYFEAQEPVTLCVRDAAQQVTTLELPAGRGRTVRGSAPFEVLSQQFEGMRIFYQGKRVAPGLLNEPHIVLRPQAIVESASEVN